MKKCMIFLALSLAACNAPPTSSQSSGASTTEPKTGSPTVAAQAKVDYKDAAATYFKQKCVVCHGDHGAGDGPGAAALNPKPRAFGDAT